MTRDPDGQPRVQLDAPPGTKATEGAFFDAKGRLVGIATRTHGPNHGLILAASRIADLIRAYRSSSIRPPSSPETLRGRGPGHLAQRAGPGSFPRDLTVSLTLSAGAGDRCTIGRTDRGRADSARRSFPFPPAPIEGWSRSACSSTGHPSGRGQDGPDRRPVVAVERAGLRREYARSPAIATDGRVFKGWAAGMESIRFPTMPDGTRVVDLSQVASFMVRPASEVCPLAAIDAEVEVRRGHEPLTRIKWSVRLNHPSKPPGSGGRSAPCRNQARLEALLDAGGWLDLNGPGRGPGRVDSRPGGRDRRGAGDRRDDSGRRRHQ